MEEQHASRRAVLHRDACVDGAISGLGGYARKIRMMKGLTMKKLLAAILATAITAMLGGCVVYPDGPGHPGGGYGKSCPPGQAKKGNC
jgi:hypothetical protein